MRGAFVLVLCLLASLFAAPAAADDLDLAVSMGDAGSGILTVDIVPTRGPGDPVGCNAMVNAQNNIVVTLVSASPDLVLAQTQLTFTTCDPQTVAFTLAPGAGAVTVSASGTGGQGSAPIGGDSVQVGTAEPEPESVPEPAHVNAAPIVAFAAKPATVEGNTLGGATVSFSASAHDDEDGDLPVSCDAADGAFFALGGPHTVTCSATDSEGAVGSDAWTFSVVDTTPPAVTLASPADHALYFTTLAPASSCSAVDIVDGAVACSADATDQAPGGHVAHASASDASGNAGGASVAYWVTDCAASSGFGNPYGNTVKAGSTLPLKFTLAACGGPEGYAPQPIQSASVLQAPQFSCLGGKTGGTSDVPRWDAAAGQFVFNWKAPSGYSGTCTGSVALRYGTSVITGAAFTVKK